MLRVVIFLLAVALFALGAAWLADRPGEVTAVWLDHRIETSVMALAAGVLLLMSLAVFLWTSIRGLLRAPRRVSSYLRERRFRRGQRALSRGLIAIGAGDVRAAQRFSEEAQRRRPGDPLAMLLAAQSAQLRNEPARAEQVFRTMLERDDTKLLGLHGLYVEARRSGDREAALAFAEEAALLSPGLAWAGQAVLESRTASGDWLGALAALESNMRHGLIGKPEYRRHRAVLLTARALAAEESDPEAARDGALEAVKLAPDLVPAAALAGRLLGHAGEVRRAARILETAWKAHPHPDVADAYAYLRSGDSARERLTRVQILARQAPDSIESRLALARAALDAREFAMARAALAPLIATPTRRTALLMAEIEETEHGDLGRAREWMARAVHAFSDPGWTADGSVSAKWLPVSPTGRLDAFEWQQPIEPMQGAGPLIEAMADNPAAVRIADRAGSSSRTAERSVEPGPERDDSDAASANPAFAAPLQSAGSGSHPGLADSPTAFSEPPERRPAALPSRQAPPSGAPDAIAPFVSVPDDPGPPEPGNDKTKPGSWRRVRRILRPDG